MCRLTTSSVPPGGSIQNPEIVFNAHASPDGPSKPPGDFWKYSRNVKTGKRLIM